MTILASFEGIGSLVFGNTRIEGIRYQFDVRQVGPLRETHGTVTFDSTQDMLAAFNAGDVVLVSKSGESMNGVLKDTKTGKTASIVLVGQPPAFPH